jgi:hypothetical protein
LLDDSSSELCKTNFRTSATGPSVEQIQQAFGNRTVANYIQAKLRISQPGDAYEQEADRVADRVMRMAEPAAINGTASGGPGIQRMCTDCEDEQAMRQAAEGKEEEEETEQPAQMKPASGPAQVASSAVTNVVGGSGQPLHARCEKLLRAPFSNRF